MRYARDHEKRDILEALYNLRSLPIFAKIDLFVSFWNCEIVEVEVEVEQWMFRFLVEVEVEVEQWMFRFLVEVEVEVEQWMFRFLVEVEVEVEQWMFNALRCA